MLYNLTDILKNAAQSSPDGIAFRCGEDEFSYCELDRKTDQLAKYLIDSGVCKGDRVGIYMDRCIETSIAVYGIMKSGAAYVPLDPLAPHSRTLFLLRDCTIQHLITVKTQSKKISGLLASETGLQSIVGISIDVCVPTVSWNSIFEISLERCLPVKILESDLAYIMYTSGSTGAPKGIMHTHHSGLTYAKLSSDLYGLHSGDKVANHAPLHFDISTFGYFSAPLASATTVIVPDAYTKLPASLSTLMEQEKISIWYSVPLALIQLLMNGVLEKRDLTTLRWVLYGGENFAPKHVRSLMSYWPNATFCNVYGPAEVNQCTFYHIETPPSYDHQIPIGQVWANTAYHILDSTDRKVPQGASGELVVRAATMMKGYWNNAALTEKSMYKEFVSPSVENLYYRTGDLVEENENGDLLFLGRNDRQIKIRGYRVELDEVESVLSRHNEVKEAAVFLTTKNGENEISAAVTVVTGSKTTDDSLIAFCKSYLPPYAIPGQVHLLRKFPRTSSGKIKRKALTEILIHL